MSTWIALLRGVNVGGHKLSMADLRTAMGQAGATDVETYIQSGNIVFGHPARSEAKAKALVDSVVADLVDYEVPVMIRSHAQLTAVIDANPYEPEQPTHLHVTFFDQPLGAGAFASIDLDAFAPETFTVSGRELYLHLPGGMGRSKLAVELNKGGRSAPKGTARNWNTVLRLADMAAR